MPHDALEVACGLEAENGAITPNERARPGEREPVDLAEAVDAGCQWLPEGLTPEPGEHTIGEAEGQGLFAREDVVLRTRETKQFGAGVVPRDHQLILRRRETPDAMESRICG